MVKRRESSNTNSKSSLRMWLLIGASSVTLAAGVILISTRTVHADTPLPRLAATAPPALTPGAPTPVLPAPNKPAETATVHVLHGLASWYGDKFNGRHTASGERFDMYAMTACHPTLPFGTVVRVVNLDNHRSVVVRITDRGYLYEGRIIDLSYGAAKKLEMTEAGLAKVQLEVISLGKSHRKNK
jgi:rare lipoprotein A